MVGVLAYENTYHFGFFSLVGFDSQDSQKSACFCCLSVFFLKSYQTLFFCRYVNYP